MQEVTTGMKDKGINDMEWIDREECRRNMKLQAHKDGNIDTLYANKVK
jgi:hypothetical protein